MALVVAQDPRAALAGVQRFLIDSALAQPQVFVHRDFMPRNLMPVDGGLAVLDFQDAVRGPVAYDPVSLVRDADNASDTATGDAEVRFVHVYEYEAE